MFRSIEINANHLPSHLPSLFIAIPNNL